MKTSVKLTPKQEKFCLLYCELGNASEAYRQAYDVSENCKPETIWENACRTLADSKVAARVMELQDEAREQHLVTVEILTNELEETRKKADKLDQPAAMTSAIMGKAKLNGLGVDKKHITHTTTSDRMREILGIE